MMRKLAGSRLAPSLTNSVKSSVIRLRSVSFRRGPMGSPLGAPIGASFVRFNSVNHKLNKDSFAYKYLVEGPKFIKYTPEHEWLAVHSDDSAFLGITLYASESLGDVTYIELPEVGQKVEMGDSIGSVESVKAASEIYSPVDGEIVAVNDTLSSSPQLINEDPIGEGWIAQIKLNLDAESLHSQEGLLDVESYDSLLNE